jgi:hypothetical protein
MDSQSLVFHQTQERKLNRKKEMEKTYIEAEPFLQKLLGLINEKHKR